MSQQVGGLLETNQSYAFNRDKFKDYRATNIDPTRFSDWQKDSMYKSSYNCFHGPNANIPKNSIVPGYQGFVPGHRADSLYAKSNSIIAKQSFSKDRLDINRSGLATNGFNITKESFLDNSKTGFSSKYGKTALQKAHPNWNEKWTTTNRLNYEDPSAVPNPLFRESERGVEGKKPQNKLSGFGQNSAYWDGTGWKPHPILNAANKGTEYQNRFNPEREFHRTTDATKEGRLKPIERNYHFNY